MSLATHSKLVVCFFVLFGFGLHGLQASSAQTASALPILNNAVVSTIAPGVIEVSGERFSPGGLVYIALYDGWGEMLHETRWVASSPTVYGPNGSQDPAQGYVAGSDGGEAFAIACDAPLMVRAFDQRTTSWSNLLDVDSGC